MKKLNIGAVVSYCTNDYRFIHHCLEGLKKYCREIVVVVSDQFSNGEKESRELLHRTYSEHLNIQFIEFSHKDVGFFGIRSQDFLKGQDKARLHISTSRYIGAFYFSDEVDYIIFIDADEIPDGEKFESFFSKSANLPDLLHFSSYIYVGDEGKRSLEHQYSHLAVKKEALQPELLLNNHERPGYFFGFQGSKINSVRGLDGNPMVHHYSWVRSSSELIKKVTTWGHSEDHNWISIIEEGKLEQALGCKLQSVKEKHNLLGLNVEYLRSLDQFQHIPTRCFHNVKKVSPSDVRKIELEQIICKRGAA
jgi:hypothetical protein